MTEKKTVSSLKLLGKNLGTELVLQVKSVSLTPFGCNLDLTDDSESIKSLYLGKEKFELNPGDYLKILNYHYKPEIFENPLIFFDFSKHSPAPKSSKIKPLKEKEEEEEEDKHKETLFPALTHKSPTSEAPNFSHSKETPHIRMYTLSTFQQILSLTIKPNDKLVFHTLCTIGLVQRNKYSTLFYIGCKSNTCKKKLEKRDSNYFCPKCKYFGSEFRYRYNLSLPLMDLNGMVYARVFDRYAEKLLGVPPEVFEYRVSENKADELVFNLFGKKIIAETRVAQDEKGHVFELINTYNAIGALPTILFELSLCKTRDINGQITE